MSLPDLIALITAKHWLPLIAFAVLIARKWTSPESSFPWTISPGWQPTVTAFGGLVFGLVAALQQGQSIGAALVSMAIAGGAGGFLDGVLTAVFNHQNAPKWARFIVMVFDDITTGKTPAAPSPDVVQRAAASLSPKPPAAPRKRLDWSNSRALGIVSVCLSVFGTVGLGTLAASGACSKPLVPPPSTPADVEGAIGCVTAALLSAGDLASCILQYGTALIADVLQTLLHSAFAKDHPELVPAMQTHLAALKAKVAP
jgi:hypothetical protein